MTHKLVNSNIIDQYTAQIKQLRSQNPRDKEEKQQLEDEL
jgi:hypothetical protein